MLIRYWTHSETRFTPCLCWHMHCSWVETCQSGVLKCGLVAQLRVCCAPSSHNRSGSRNFGWGRVTLFATPIIYLQHLFSKFHYQLGSRGGGGLNSQPPWIRPCINSTDKPHCRLHKLLTRLVWVERSTGKQVVYISGRVTSDVFVAPNVDLLESTWTQLPRQRLWIRFVVLTSHTSRVHSGILERSAYPQLGQVSSGSNVKCPVAAL